MKRESGKEKRLFAIICWALALFFFIAFLLNSKEVPGWYFILRPATPRTMYDLSYLVAAVVFFLLPSVSHIRLGGFLELKREVDRTREDVKSLSNQVTSLFSVISAASAVANIKIENHPLEGTVKKEQAERSEPKEIPRTYLEGKILNTLWNRQVLKFPDLDKYFTFTVDGDAGFEKARDLLIRSRLITLTDTGHVSLTRDGLEYCVKHYTEFPDDMWFEYKPLDKANAEKLAAKLESN